MSDLEWSEPPPHRRGPGKKSKRAETLELLHDHPGEWALVERCDRARTAVYVKRWIEGNEQHSTISKGMYEAVSRRIDGENCHGVWARYVGPDDDA